MSVRDYPHAEIDSATDPAEPGGGCEMKVGEKVIYNGYDGTVIEVHAGVLAGMVDVRLDAGVVCVSSLDLKK
jgi:hypothetical protein